MAREGTSVGDLKIANAALAEMAEAFRVFRPYRHIRKITMFGSARTKPDDPVYVLARNLAARLAAADWMVVTGAGPGIMAAGLEGAGREHAFGVNIRLPHEEDANPFIAQDPKLVEMRYFFTRKLMLIKESHAYAVLPGGFGTQDESFELLTLLQTGKAEPAPVVMIETPGGTYWHAWLRFVEDEAIAAGWVSPEDRALFKVTNTMEEASEEILGFYRNYHSCRWVGDLLVLRLQVQPSKAELADLNRRFADIVVARQHPHRRPLPARAQRPPRAAPARLPLRPLPLRAAAPAHRRHQRVHGVTTAPARLGRVLAALLGLVAVAAAGLGASRLAAAPVRRRRPLPRPTRWCRSARPPSAPTRWRTPTRRSWAWPPTPDGGGYWLVGSDGGVFSYGDAGFFGSAGSLRAQRADRGHGGRRPTAAGYWLVARDGGIFSYGDARFFGSAGSLPLNAPVVGMAATHDGGGYWLVAADGGIFSYGDARFSGSAGSPRAQRAGRGHGARRPTAAGTGWWPPTAASSATATRRSPAPPAPSRSTRPIVGMAATSDGGGYWLVARDGGVFTYGDAPYFGSLGGTAAARTRRRAWRPTPAGAGYWLAVGSEPLAGKVVGIDPGHNGLELQRARPSSTSPSSTAPGTSRATRRARRPTAATPRRSTTSTWPPTSRPTCEAEGATVVLTRPNNDGVGPVRHDSGGHHQRRPRGRRRRHPRRRWAAGRARLRRARAGGGRAQRRRHRVLGRLRLDAARRLRWPARPCRSATTTASTACSRATTWPG